MAAPPDPGDRLHHLGQRLDALLRLGLLTQADHRVEHRQPGQHDRGPHIPRDQRNTVFSRAALPGPTQLRRYGLALLAIILVTTIGFLQRIFETTELRLSQWSICVGIAASLVVVEELIKLVIRRRDRRRVAAPAPRSLSGA